VMATFIERFAKFQSLYKSLTGPLLFSQQSMKSFLLKLRLREVEWLMNCQRPYRCCQSRDQSSPTPESLAI
jgi:hypothetical protein